MQYPVANPHIGPKEREYVVDCLDKHWISSSGEYITRFEEQFAMMFGPGLCVATGNGTVALDLAMCSLGIKEGDEVLAPNFTFAGTISPIYRAHGIPVLVPPGRNNWNMDPAALEKFITKKTRAIAVVHLYGVPCDMEGIMELARKHGLLVIEDCAEALGAKVHGQYVGTFGDVACFSFFGNKVLTTGEGGMCMTRSKSVHEGLRLYRDHGMKTHERYWHRVVGYNGRMTNLQAAIGCGQLEQIRSMISRRNEIHRIYQDHFRQRDYFLQIDIPKSAEPVNWLESPVLMANRNLDRDLLIAQLKQENIDSRPFFYPMSNMPAFAKFGMEDPQSNYFAAHGINLPTYIGMSDEDVAHVAQKVMALLDRQDKKGSGVTIPLKTPDSKCSMVYPKVSIILLGCAKEKDSVKCIHNLSRQMAAAQEDFEIMMFMSEDNKPCAGKIRENFAHDRKLSITTDNLDANPVSAVVLKGLASARGDLCLVIDAHDPAGVDMAGPLVAMAKFYDLVMVSDVHSHLEKKNQQRKKTDAGGKHLACFCIKSEKFRELGLQGTFMDAQSFLEKLAAAAGSKKLGILNLPRTQR